jgi:hypothetical protein
MTIRLVKSDQIESRKKPERKGRDEGGAKQLATTAQGWVDEFKARRSKPDPFLVKLRG